MLLDAQAVCDAIDAEIQVYQAGEEIPKHWTLARECAIRWENAVRFAGPPGVERHHGHSDAQKRSPVNNSHRAA
jgi:hypothetical protein